MNYLEAFEFWKTDLFFDEETRNELSLLDKENDKKEIEDRFYRDLEFGTGGLRGIMGAGTNRMNKYTVGKATTGLGKYLIDIVELWKSNQKTIMLNLKLMTILFYHA